MEKNISKAVERKLVEIAKRNSINIEERGDLERRWRDSEDFLDISVWEIKAMLEEAYKLGAKVAKESK